MAVYPPFEKCTDVPFSQSRSKPIKKSAISRQQAEFWFMVISFMAYSLTLKMEALHSSKTSVNFYWTAWHYFPKDSILHSLCYENLISNISTG
jgi:hypothetical protein